MNPSSQIENYRIRRTQQPPRDKFVSAIQLIARIHAGIPGQRIPGEVINFYKIMKNGDSFRPAILKQIVLTLEDQMACGMTDRQNLKTAVRNRLKTVAARQPNCRLEQWLLADVRRERLIPCAECDWTHRLRAGYVAEGMEMLDDTMAYVAALSAY